MDALRLRAVSMEMRHGLLVASPSCSANNDVHLDQPSRVSAERKGREGRERFTVWPADLSDVGTRSYGRRGRWSGSLRQGDRVTRYTGSSGGIQAARTG